MPSTTAPAPRKPLEPADGVTDDDGFTLVDAWVFPRRGKPGTWRRMRLCDVADRDLQFPR